MPKPDPAQTLVGAISLNTLAPGESVYAACAHSSFKTLAWGLAGVDGKISLEKSEFETDAEFAGRRGKLEDALNGIGLIVVCQPLEDNEDAPFRYDAEREMFVGSFSGHQNVWRDVRKTGSYVSRTRMGVRATVTSSVDIEYDIDMGSALRDRERKCLKSDYISYSYEVPAPRSGAPALKANGYLAFVGRIVSPFVDVSDSPGSPTLDDPHDVYERTITVYFAPNLVTVVGPVVQPWECKLAD